MLFFRVAAAPGEPRGVYYDGVPKGYYRYGGDIEGMPGDGLRGTYHPDPFRDGIGDFNQNEYFGFISIDQLFDWFGPMRSLPDELCIYVYDTDGVRQGRRQATAQLAGIEPVATFKTGLDVESFVSEYTHPSPIELDKSNVYI